MSATTTDTTDTTDATAMHKAIQSAKAEISMEMKLLYPFRVSLHTFLENIARDIENNSIGVLLVGLESACGARAIELINKKVATFETIPNLPGFVRQTGQAKTNGREVEPITKPIIGVTVDRFLERLEYARKFTNADVDNGMDNRALAKKYQPSSTDHVRSIYPSMKKGSGTHKMRAVYSKASYLIHNPNEEVSPSVWMKTVLGHGSYTNLKYYDSVIVTRGPIVKPADVPMAIAEIWARLAALEGEKSDENVKKAEDVLIKPEDVPMAIADIWAPLATLEADKSSETDKKAEEVLINTEEKKKRRVEQVEVDFITIDNKKVSIKKLKRVRNKTEDETKDLVRQAEELLRSHNVKITKDNLTFLGIGSTSVCKYRTM